MASRSTDALVVGGGVVGLAAACELAGRGRSVRLLERRALGSGASWANCGLVVPSHAVPLPLPGVARHALADLLRPDAPFRIRPRLDPALIGWLWRFMRSATRAKAARAAAVRGPLLRRSSARLAEWIEREKLECSWQRAGLLVVYATDASLAGSGVAHELEAAAGVESRALDAKALVEMEPSLRDGLAGARFYPGDAHLRPEALVGELERLARRRGVEILTDHEVDGLLIERGDVVGVQARSAAFRARDTVLAAGAWSPLVARSAGLRLPIQPGKGYTVTLPAPSGGPRIPMILHERSVAVTPWASGLRIGSTMELAGYDAGMNRVRLAALERGAREYLREPPDPRAPREEWYGWRPMTPDDMPIIGRARRRSLVLASGHGMLGVSLCAATAELVADLIEGRDPAVDPAPFSAARF
jgi:D-amino-acid dehydrogenase